MASRTRVGGVSGMITHPVVVAIEDLGPEFETWVWTGRTLGDISMAQAEALFGMSLPADYKAFILEHGCAAVLSHLPTVGLEVYGLARVCPTPMDMRERFTRLVAAGVTGLVPVAGPPRGEPVLAVDAHGVFHHLDGTEAIPIPGTFSEIVSGLVQAVAEEVAASTG